jgi:hypothetical protein
MSILTASSIAQLHHVWTYDAVGIDDEYDE